MHESSEGTGFNEERDTNDASVPSVDEPILQVCAAKMCWYWDPAKASTFLCRQIAWLL